MYLNVLGRGEAFALKTITPIKNIDRAKNMIRIGKMNRIKAISISTYGRLYRLLRDYVAEDPIITHGNYF